MNINLPNNIVFNPADGDPAPARQTARQVPPAEDKAADLSLGVDHQDVVKKALESDAKSTLSAQEIEELLQTDAIDSIENIRLAAANILNFGI